MNKAILLLLILTALSLPLRVQAAITTIDGFKICDSGSVTISGAGINAVAVQPWDRKIIIGGSFTATSVGSGESRSNLARLNFDGTLDTGFTAVADGPVHAVVIQLHQKFPEVPENNAILVGGSFTKITATRIVDGNPQQDPVPRRGIARLATAGGYPDGFDPGTGTDGTAVSAIAVDPVTGDIALGGVFSEMDRSWCSNVAVLTPSGAFKSDLSGGVTGGGVAAIVWHEGMIFLGGNFLLPRPNLVRFAPDGVLDPSFVPAPSGGVRALSLQPDGSLLMGGDFTSVATPNFPSGKERLHLARVNGDGLLDDFDPGAGGGAASVSAVVMEPDGRILIGGSFESLLHPSGRPAAGETAAPRKGAARLRLNGALDLTVNPATDAAVNAIALQPDGKFLIAGGFSSVKGGERPRTRLARYYPYGELDDDVFPIGTHFRERSDPYNLMYYQDDGHLTFGGSGEKIDDWDSCSLIRLNPDWSVTDYATNCPIPPLGFNIFDVSPKLDGSPIITGPFRPTINEEMYEMAIQTRQDLTFDPDAAFNDNLVLTYDAGAFVDFVKAVVHLPDGNMFLGGGFYTEDCLTYLCPPEYNLRKVTKDGLPYKEADGSEYKPLIDGPILALALEEHPQDGDKLLVGSINGVKRLKADGTEDLKVEGVPGGFTPYAPPPGAYGTWPLQITLQPDGKILVNGYFDEETIEGGTIWSRYLVRLESNGVLDNSYKIDAASASFGEVMVKRVHLQADGKAIMTGNFETVRGATGPNVNRHCVARVDANGMPDDLNLGTIDYYYLDTRGIDNSLLLPDGKLVIGGPFLYINGDTSKAHLARVAVGSATETLTVSPDGQSVTWLRGGATPEATRVVFEHSPDGSEGSWQTMGSTGRGKRITGGWQIDYDLTQHGYNQNRYVRASAYLVGMNGGGYLHRNVVLYYLRPEVKVQARPVGREYGEDNPFLRADYLLKDGTQIQPLAVSGAPRVTTTAAKLDPVGEYPISVTLGSIVSWRYRFTTVDDWLTVREKVIHVFATPQRKAAGAPDPSPLPYTYSPALLPGDSFSGSLSRTGDETTGPHRIEQGSLSLDPNYSITFHPSDLTIFAPAVKAAQTITFPDPGEKTFGDSDFELGATASSGLPVSYSISNPALTEPVGTKIRVHSPGIERTGSIIVASQPGDPFYDKAPDQQHTVFVNPPPGNSLYFDGVDDLLQVPDKPQLHFSAKAGFTVEAWIYVDGPQPDGSAILSKATSGMTWQGFQLFLFKDRLAAELGDGENTVRVAPPLSESYPLNDLYWHHVALTVDRASATATLYLDGRVEARASNPLLGGSLDSTEPLLVGVDRSTMRYFHGQVDELRVWDVARSISEIRSAAGFILDPPAEPQLMAYYHFDEGEEWGDNHHFTKAPERTANGVNGNDGILSGYTLQDDESNWVVSSALAPVVYTTSFSWQGATPVATGGGIVYPNYFPIKERGFCWSIRPHPTHSDMCDGFGTGEGVFEGAIIDLKELGDTYYFRAFATNAVGTSYGNDIVLRRLGKQTQNIQFSLTGKTYGDPLVPLEAAADSRLPVSYESSDQSVAMVVNGNLRIMGAGSAVITATQGGDDSYFAAPPVSLTFNVAQAPLTVSADHKTRAYLAANPALTVSYLGLVNGDLSSVVSGTPLLSTTATQQSPVGDYDILVDVAPLTARNYRLTGGKGVLSVVKADQQIIFPPLGNKSYGDGEFTPGAAADSGLPVTYASSDQSVAVVVNGKIRIVGAGAAVITASQGGSEGFNPAASVSRTLNVAQATLTVRADYKARVFLAPNPPLTVSYRGLVNGDPSTVVSGSPLLTTTATQESPVGDYDILVDVAPLSARNYRFVAVNALLSVVKSCQQIIFPPIGEKTYGDPPFELIAYSCSGLPIGFVSSDPAVARLQGNLVAIAAAGSAVITASQPGSGDTEAAPDVSRTLLVHRARQELTFPELPRRVLGDPPVTLSATASSGLPVRYRSSDPAVAEVAGNVAAIVAPGTAVITASQEGDANFDAALPLSRPLVVAAEGIPPRLTLSTLSSGSVTSNPVLNVTGSASDPSGIASLTVNDRDLAPEAELFSAALALRSGENSVKVTATDGAGNRESREIEVRFDAAAPLLEVGVPADNSVTDTAYFEVAGSASKGSSVAIALNGGARQTAQTSGDSFSASGYLQEGVNTVEVTAELSGRSATLKRSVTLSYGKPYVAVTDPPQDVRTEQETLTLSGVAGTRGGEATLALELELDGASVPVALQGGGLFRKEIPLHEGENRIRAKVSDASGNQSSAQRTVIRYARVPGDLNGDGLVDIRDVLTALRMSLGIETVTDAALVHGDVAPLVNGVSQPDGRIDVGDVLVLLRKVVGLADF